MTMPLTDKLIAAGLFLLIVAALVAVEYLESR